MMSSENNNSSTSALLPECHYRNKYEKWYWSIIEKCPKTKPLAHETECHHIVPKCLGGSLSDPENLCNPSLREHFVLHRLLNKMYPKHEGLWYAIFRMSASGGGRVYQFLRENYVRSKEHNLKISESLKGKPHSLERRKRISESRIGNPKVCYSNHPMANKELWEKEQEIKKLWLENGKPNGNALRRLYGFDRKCKTFYTMVRKFREEDIV